MRTATRLLLVAQLASLHVRAEQPDEPGDEQSVKRACVAASDNGQKLRDTGKLLAAEAAFLACGAESCPPIVRSECSAWLAGVVQRIPSLTVSVRDREGRDLPYTDLHLDGVSYAKSRGQAIRLDPGAHRVSLRLGERVLSQTATLLEGEQGRRVSFVLDTEPEPHPPRRPNWPAWGLAGASVALLGVAAGLGLSARNDREDLEASCAGQCSDAQLAPVRRKLLLGDLALGGSALLAGGAVWLWVAAPAVSVPQSQPPAQKSVVSFLMLSGRF